MTDVGGCPLDSRCTGCGSPHALGVVVSTPGPDDRAACVTVCPSCAGRDLTDMVSTAAVAGLVAAHATHVAPEPD